MYLQSAPENETEIKVVWFCHSLDTYLQEGEEEKMRALGEFLRREKSNLGESGMLLFLGMENTPLKNDSVYREKVKKFHTLTGLDALFIMSPAMVSQQMKKESVRKGKKKKSKSKTEPAWPFYYTTMDNNQVSTFHKNDIMLQFSMKEPTGVMGGLQFIMEKPEVTPGKRYYYFINNKSLPLFGLEQNDYYLNCSLPYGSMGVLNLFFRNSNVIRQSADTIKINTANNSNSWFVP